MHLALKKEATKPVVPDVRQQQARFDAFVDRYNQDRPHQASNCSRIVHGLAQRFAPTEANVQDVHDVQDSIDCIGPSDASWNRESLRRNRTDLAGCR